MEKGKRRSLEFFEKKKKKNLKNCSELTSNFSKITKTENIRNGPDNRCELQMKHVFLAS